MILNHFPDRVIYDNGIEYLYFGGTNYLGITTNPDFQTILFESIKKWGVSYGSSRNSNIKLSVYEAGEQLLADTLKTEATLTVSSGMLAGKMITELLLKQGYTLFHFPNTHTALVHPASLPLFKNGLLNSAVFKHSCLKIAVLADAYPALEVEPINLSILDALPIDKKITLVLDESHSIGLIGNQGQGILSTINHPNIHQKIGIASLGKACGLSGGVIMGNQHLIDQLKKENTFVSASGMNPAFLETYIKSQAIYTVQRQKLHHNLNHFATLFINHKKYTFDSNYPIIYFECESVLELLTKNNIIPTSFSYPTTSGKLNRLVITANHTLADIEKLCNVLNSVFE